MRIKSMDEIVKKPHKLVIDEVQKRWSSRYSKGVLSKLTNFIVIRPAAIEIVQTDHVDKGFKYCTGDTSNIWRYDDAGLQLLPPNADIGKQKVEYCYYCIDKEKKRIAILWTNMFSGALRGSKVQYFHDGSVYEINEKNGAEHYELISTWME